MRDFLDSNPGLRSRFTRTVTFADYSAAELATIYTGMAARTGFQLDDRAQQALGRICADMEADRGETFGNGRAVRNLWERTKKAQASRVLALKRRTAADLVVITAEDMNAPPGPKPRRRCEVRPRPHRRRTAPARPGRPLCLAR